MEKGTTAEKDQFGKRKQTLKSRGGIYEVNMLYQMRRRGKDREDQG